MFHFLVPCECGKKLEVTSAQAGQRLTCVCGRSVDVPTLRHLQSLERTAEAAAPAPRRWGAKQGLVFLGAAIAVLALIAAAALEFTRPRDMIVVERIVPHSTTPGLPIQDSIEPAANFDYLTPADIWLTWQISTPVGADPRPSFFGALVEKNESRWMLNWQDWRYLVWIIGGFGTVLIIAGLLIPSRRARPAPRNRAGATG